MTSVADTTTPAGSLLAYRIPIDLLGGNPASVTVAELIAIVLASATLTGDPTAPTLATADSDTSVATTAFVHAVIAALVDSSPGALDTLNELAAALGDDPNFAATINALITARQTEAQVNALVAAALAAAVTGNTETGITVTYDANTGNSIL